MSLIVLPGAGALAVRGIVALLFGIVALLLPAGAFVAFVIAFGIYALLNGVFALVSAVKGRDRDGRGWLTIEGVAGIATGILTLIWPGMTGVALVYLVGAWALVTGIMNIVLAIRLRKEIQGEWLMILSGLASIGLAVLVVLSPIAATLAMVWALGIYALVFGTLFLSLSFRIRNFERVLADRVSDAA